MSRTRVWLIDGHNMIHAVHGLRILQISGRGEEARRGLAERLEVFALRREERVLVVFDGDARATGQGVARSLHIEVVFARGDEGAADHFIVREARRYLEEGRPVVVVTNDFRTLANRLPRGVIHHRVPEFWRAHVEPHPSADDKQVAVEISDLEREMLAQAAAGGWSNAVGEPGGRARPAEREPPRSERDAAGDLRRRKRERGRLRQARLLKRRGGAAGGGAGRG